MLTIDHKKKYNKKITQPVIITILLANNIFTINIIDNNPSSKKKKINKNI